MTNADNRTLIVERKLPAPPAKVFEAWADPDLLRQWYGPVGVTVAELSLDLNPGGAWRTVFDTPEGQRTVSGVYREIEAPKRLVFTWGWEDGDGARGHETIVTVEFEAAGGGTLMRLTQATFEAPEARDHHEKGWSSMFDALQSFLG